jgi:hypothetical protein
MITDEMQNFGTSDFDPFSDEALADPFLFHQNLRDRGHCSGCKSTIFGVRHDMRTSRRYCSIIPTSAALVVPACQIILSKSRGADLVCCWRRIRHCTSRRTVLGFGLCRQGQ